jgi:hypothetical protein
MANWTTAMENLMRRRAERSIKAQPKIDDYEAHIAEALCSEWILPGDTLLDVGCGEMKVQKILHDSGWNGKYIGLDPFPLQPSVVNGVIEEWDIGEHVDSAVCFAVLDGTKDIEKALSVLNKIVRRSIIILTGIGIDPDNCHTFRIDFSLLKHGLSDFINETVLYLHPKVVLLHFKRA